MPDRCRVDLWSPLLAWRAAAQTDWSVKLDRQQDRKKKLQTTHSPKNWQPVGSFGDKHRGRRKGSGRCRKRYRSATVCATGEARIRTQTPWREHLRCPGENGRT